MNLWIYCFQRFEGDGRAISEEGDIAWWGNFMVKMTQTEENLNQGTKTGRGGFAENRRFSRGQKVVSGNGLGERDNV